MNISEEHLTQALNHAFDMGALEAIGKSGVLSGLPSPEAREKRRAEILNATVPQMRQTTRGLLLWLARPSEKGEE
jgi:hypothetical protein